MGAFLFVIWTVFVFFVGAAWGYEAKILPESYERAKVACFELASGSPVKEFTRTRVICQNGAVINITPKQ